MTTEIHQISRNGESEGQAAPQLVQKARIRSLVCMWCVEFVGVAKHHALTVSQRRRAQNRASQRAFRERKEKHLKGLEHQLEDLHEKHQDLLQSYTRQADEVTKLNNRIAELTAELGTLRSCQDQSFSEMLIPDKFDKFDAFGAHDMLYNRSDSYADGTALDFDSEFPLDSLGGSL